MDDDPVYRRSLREAILLLVVWVVTACWSVTYCYLFGYTDHPREPGNITGLLPDLTRFDQTGAAPTDPLGWGMPGWVFWGIFAPWMGSILFSIWFALVCMKDEPVRDKEENAA